ncbi:Rho GTPase activating protein [Diatrype stigma]|uniref:Rho GTPase activating protein n=1 Tax=Diatrype stigma TaxID=117547 RepID=A0AAN9U8N6_9PEZI
MILGSSKATFHSTNEKNTVPDRIESTRPPVGSGAGSADMGSPSISSNPGLGKGPARTSSIDSAISAISSNRASPETGAAEIANLVKAAGTPEAVIQYLLKEKHSQSQQNAQLWRLVDKQRAMILGLNKDLERALKDKEKYRKKLKEVMAVQESHSKDDSGESTAPAALPRIGIDISKAQAPNGPPSPSNADSNSVRHSPIDVSLAPYPITPPADQITNAPSAVEDMLDPSRAMPRPSEHALDHFDHEEEDRATDAANKGSDVSNDFAFNLSLPPSRSLPSEPPRGPPPNPPTAPIMSVIEATPMIDQGSPKFPPPSAPPPRKPPPTPVPKRAEANSSPILPDDDVDSDSDYDSLLAVDDVPVTERRGRRQTREEDDRIREILALKEAEARSLSKKSKKSSHKGSPTAPMPDATRGERLPDQTSMAGQQALGPASLAGMLSGDELQPRMLTAPLLSPGLPASPRPGAFRSPMNSPMVSPRGGMGMAVPSAPLSPRAPRQPIPLPPNASRSAPSPAETTNTSGSKPQDEAGAAHTNIEEPQSPTGPGKVYKGFVTDEYPDLLLAPNAIPHVQVKVASSRMKPSRASMLSLTQLEEDPVFTLAVFSRSERVELWRVEKDITSFGKLDQRMKQCPAFTARTPDRSLFSGHAPAKLDARRLVLDQYLDELLDTQLDLPSALELCKYLSTNILPPHTDDTTPTPEMNAQIGSQTKGPGGRILKNGYLTKRGKNFGGWKARFFVLDGPQLKYFETPGGAHLGTIKLQTARIGKQSQQSDNSPVHTKTQDGDELDNEYRHAFLILEPKKKDSTSHVKHVLCAESDRERDQWVEALLGWINFKDGNEDDSPTSATASNDRPAQAPSGTTPRTNAKKKGPSQGRPQEQRARNNDNLIGMSYDSAKQGDLPEGAPQRRGTGSPELKDRVGDNTYTISAPRDPQVISDTSSWGGKAALAPPGPSIEEKKQRKRSFFGFGTKARASPEEQDPSYGGGGGGGGSGQGVHIRHVFGAMLGEAVKYNSPVDVSVPLPAVVYRCIQYLDERNAIFEEGIFRLSGSNIVIKQLRERFNTEGDVNLLTDETYYDIHAVASLLKLYLRELPTTILTRELHMQFVTVTEMTNKAEKLAAVAELVERMPQANATLLKYLLAFLIRIINNADMNKMTVRNVGIVFSPTLNIPAPVFALLLQNYQAVFGIEPEEYELPLPASEADARQPIEPQPRRPSTAAGTASSPHRRGLMEQQRSTPTPPPGGPLPSRPNGYDAPRNLQGSASQSSMRPPYEGGFGAPYNQNAMPAASSKQQQPAYDRPHYAYSYESGSGDNNNLSAPSDDAQSSRAKRRGSAMFMMNDLNTQGSKSHLREEVRM